ncbi:RelA/SpoT domain-containing protein [Flavihumibacter solisilvae]|uniref:RelA/SpoT domain-containing protein n=1 Tax=Flavihumibacter solisilvae TaxID=1349421 RepID=UPI00068F62BC|nr:hypothetical protein [Flavihumibacter solisilvae]
MKPTLMLSQEDFLKKYNISEDRFTESGLDWNELASIYSDYSEYMTGLEPTAQFVMNLLMKAKDVHSVRYRIKNPEHLIDKIIRKKLNDPTLNITVSNYKKEVTDLIGLRALHLFKEDWARVHDYINQKWNQHEQPTANFRKGDLEKDGLNYFIEKGCRLNEHKFGYRSVHYVIEVQPIKEKILIEIQVRTIYEEAWSEIDHTIRYPNNVDDLIYSKFLMILNRLSGSADEMGSFLMFLQEELNSERTRYRTLAIEHQNALDKLEQTISSSKMTRAELTTAKAELERLRTPVSTGLFNFSNNPEPKYVSTLFDVATSLHGRIAPLIQSAQKLQSYSNVVKLPEFLHGVREPVKLKEVKNENIEVKEKPKAQKQSKKAVPVRTPRKKKST